MATAVHFRYTLEEWGDTALFVELFDSHQLKSAERIGGEGWDMGEGNLLEAVEETEDKNGTIFDGEIYLLEDFFKEGVASIVAAIERGLRPLISAYFSDYATIREFEAEIEV